MQYLLIILILFRRVEQVIFLAQDKRKGPVWIDIPLDIQNMHVEEKVLYVSKIKNHKLKKKL